MAKKTAVDQAFERYRILSMLVHLERDRARANPLHQRYLDLGIIEMGDTKLDAEQKTVETFDMLAQLIDHVAILDMAGSFERSFRAKIGTTIGRIRRLIRDDSESDQSSYIALNLVRHAEDFEGLRDIIGLLEGTLSRQVVEAIALVRRSRNAFAHGTDLKIPPAVEPTQARDNLNEIVSHF